MRQPPSGLEPPIFAAAAAQAMFLGATFYLLAQESGGIILTAFAVASTLVPTALLLGTKPSALRAIVGGGINVVLQLPIINGGTTGHVLASAFLIPVLVLIFVPAQRLVPRRSLLLRAILVLVAGTILITSSAYVPYPFGWLVAAAPLLGLIGQGRRPRLYTLCAVVLGLVYGASLIFVGPLTTAASFSGTCGIIALTALLLLGRTEPGISPQSGHEARPPIEHPR
jgi:hypothetical protein